MQHGRPGWLPHAAGCRVDHSVWLRSEVVVLHRYVGAERDLTLLDIDDRTITRPEGYRRSMLRMLRPFPGAGVDLLDVATRDAARYAGVRVAVTWRLSSTYAGAADFGPLTGSTVDVLGISEFLVPSARIVKETRVYDGIAISTQIAHARGDEPHLSTNTD